MDGQPVLYPVAAFSVEALTLKGIPRSGWSRIGVPLGSQETIAGHTFGSAVIGTLLGLMQGANVERIALLCTFHDIGETRSQDITPPLKGILEEFGVHKEQIDQRAEGMQRANLPTAIAKFLEEALKEYRAQETPEAQCASDAQLLDLGIQALWYLRQGHSAQGFINEVSSRLQTEAGKSLWECILQNPSVFDDWFSR